MFQHKGVRERAQKYLCCKAFVEHAREQEQRQDPTGETGATNTELADRFGCWWELFKARKVYFGIEPLKPLTDQVQRCKKKIEELQQSGSCNQTSRRSSSSGRKRSAPAAGKRGTTGSSGKKCKK